VLIIAAVTPMTGTVEATSASSRCTDYAETAVAQHEENQRSGCRFTDPRWHSDYSAHYEWCRHVPADESARENQVRREMLSRCGQPGSNGKNEACKAYAQKAVAQYHASRNADCNLTDPRWHDDYAAHYHFCLEVSAEESARENQDRQQLLDDCAPPPPAQPQPQPDRAVIAAEKRIRLAVIEFKTLADKGGNAQLGVMVSEMFTTEVVNSDAFKIVEREQLEKVLKEIAMAQSGIIDTTTAQEIGRMLGADAIITGSVIRIQSNLRIDARIIEVETGVVVSAVNRFCTEELADISRQVKAITRALAQNFYR
jgi:TolB-like protein